MDKHKFTVVKPLSLKRNFHKRIAISVVHLLLFLIVVYWNIYTKINTPKWKDYVFTVILGINFVLSISKIYKAYKNLERFRQGFYKSRFLIVRKDVIEFKDTHGESTKYREFEVKRITYNKGINQIVIKLNSFNENIKLPDEYDSPISVIYEALVTNLYK